LAPWKLNDIVFVLFAPLFICLAFCWKLAAFDFAAVFKPVFGSKGLRALGLAFVSFVIARSIGISVVSRDGSSRDALIGV